MPAVLSLRRSATAPSRRRPRRRLVNRHHLMTPRVSAAYPPSGIRRTTTLREIFMHRGLCGNHQCVGCDDAAVLAPSSGEEPASPRHRAGVASMAWRSQRRFSEQRVKLFPHRSWAPSRKRGHQGRVRGRHPGPGPARCGHDVHGADTVGPATPWVYGWPLRRPLPAR